MAREFLGPRDTLRRVLVRAYLKDGAEIASGDCVKRDANGFIEECGAADGISGVATQAAENDGGGDGAASILIDISEHTVYYVATSAAPTRALEGKSCDLAGPQEISIAAGALDNVFVHEVDIEREIALVSYKILSDYVSVVP